MCVGGTPDVPQVPERQSAKMPDQGQVASRVDDRSKRRLAYAATILTSPQGVLGAANTTASMAGKTGA